MTIYKPSGRKPRKTVVIRVARIPGSRYHSLVVNGRDYGKFAMGPHVHKHARILAGALLDMMEDGMLPARNIDLGIEDK